MSHLHVPTTKDRDSRSFCHFFANSRRVEEKRRRGSGIWSYQPDSLASAISSPQLLSMQSSSRDTAMTAMRGSKDAISSTPHSSAWQTPQSDQGKGKHHASYKKKSSLLLRQHTFILKHRIQSFLEKATTLFKLNMFCFLDRLVSSSAGLTQALLYPGKCGWSLLIFLLGPEQQWRYMLGQSKAMRPSCRLRSPGQSQPPSPPPCPKDHLHLWPLRAAKGRWS